MAWFAQPLFEKMLLPLALFAPLAGWFSDHFNLGTGLAVSGGFILILSVLTLGLFIGYYHYDASNIH